MNKDLLKTPIVRGQIKRYLGMGMTLKEILAKLEDIHLIIISEDELKQFIQYSL